MKIYTEEQVKKAIEMARSSYNSFSTPFIYGEHEVIQQLKSTEIPRDEEIIENTIKPLHGLMDKWDEGFLSGAKWMRDKIQGGNKL